MDLYYPNSSELSANDYYFYLVLTNHAYLSDLLYT